MSWLGVVEWAAIATAALNLAVSFAVCLSRGLTWNQKMGQLVLVWALPVLGGSLLGLFMWTQRGSAPATGYPSTSDRPRPGLCVGTQQLPPSTGGS